MLTMKAIFKRLASVVAINGAVATAEYRK